MNRYVKAEPLPPKKSKKLKVLRCLVVSNSAIQWTVAARIPVHGILQARILERVAISPSRG